MTIRSRNIIIFLLGIAAPLFTQAFTYTAATSCSDRAHVTYDTKVTAAKQIFITAKADASTALSTAIERARKDTARKRNYVDKGEASISLGEHRKKEENRARAVYNRTVRLATKTRDASITKLRKELRTALAQCK